MTTLSEQEKTLQETQAKTAIEAHSLYGFLAAVFRREMSRELLQHLRSAPAREVLAEAGIDLGSDFNTRPEDEMLEDLSVEFTALFIGPGGHISPHESVYNKHDSRLWGDETVAVKAYIEQSGFSYDDTFSGVPDHISVELEYMAAIAHQEAEAWDAGNRDVAANCIEFEAEFLDRHLGRWAPVFCERVIATSSDSVFAKMAHLTMEFLASEREDLKRRAIIAGTNVDKTSLGANGQKLRKTA